MAIWFDMTYSLVDWKAGVVGIVRAELELARQLKKENPALKICVLENDKIREVQSSELNWLWNAESVSDAYLEKFGRKADLTKGSNIDNSQGIPVVLREALANDAGRIIKIRDANTEIINNAKHRQLTRVALRTIELPLRISSRIRLKIKAIRNRGGNRLTIERKQAEFKCGDKLFSCGWFSSGKEKYFQDIKCKTNDFSIIYLVYDLVLENDTTSFLYPKEIRKQFEKYLKWISNNCDYVVYGGQTAQHDCENYLKKRGMRVPKGDYIKFGSNIINSVATVKFENVKCKYNIDDRYILMVGSLDAKKNQDVLYRAYTMLHESYGANEYPQLVIVGNKKSDDMSNLYDCITLDPRVKDKILLVSPTDAELRVIYENAEFFVHSSLYEGWSLTLPEALSFGKFCIVSDVQPFREVGRDLIEYIDPHDPQKWANAIMKYYQDGNLLKTHEKRIKNSWVDISWEDSGKSLHKIINNATYCVGNKGCLYYDMTLLLWAIYNNAGVSGITRTQIILARKLYERTSNIAFYAMNGETYVELNEYDLEIILDEDYSIDEAVVLSKERVIGKLNALNVIPNRVGFFEKNKYAVALLISIMPSIIRNKIVDKIRKSYSDEGTNIRDVDFPFEKNDIVFSAGTGYSMNVYLSLKKNKEKNGFKFIQLIYDFTPQIVPQTHRVETREYYEKFLHYSYLVSDVIFYGGETAMRDGAIYEKQNGIDHVKGKVIRFGSDIVNKDIGNEEAQKILRKYCLNREYILVVGTIEARKNYETLYLAYLSWLEDTDDVPQLVFAGYPGWKTKELIRNIKNDVRVKNKIIICTPSDDELHVLYENCLYTILASQYEGWSLTLPQSLNYGKFCLSSNVDPLTEIGKDYISYVNALDNKEWYSKMRYYYTNRDILNEYEQRIKKEWHSITWDECADVLVSDLEI